MAQKVDSGYGADIGVMYDGDADRVGFVDDTGELWMGVRLSCSC